MSYPLYCTADGSFYFKSVSPMQSSTVVVISCDAYLIRKFPWLSRMPEPLKRSPQTQDGKVRESHSRATPVRLPPRTHFLRRLDRGLLLDVGQLDKTSMNSTLLSDESPTNGRWVGERKMRITQAYNSWKAPKTPGDNFSLPNVPGGKSKFLYFHVSFT
jgi:hypothetical protein